MLNLEEIKKFEQEQKEKTAKEKHETIESLVQAMALFRVGYPVEVLVKADERVFRDFRPHGKTPASKISEVCGFFTQSLFRLLDRKTSVDLVWDGIRKLKLHQSAEEAMVCAGEVLKKLDNPPQEIAASASPSTTPAAVPEMVPAAVPEMVSVVDNPDDGFKTTIGEVAPVLATEKKRRDAAKAATKKKGGKK